MLHPTNATKVVEACLNKKEFDICQYKLNIPQRYFKVNYAGLCTGNTGAFHTAQ